MESICRESQRSRVIAFASVAVLHLVLLQSVYWVTQRSPHEDERLEDTLVWLRLDPRSEPRTDRETDAPRPASRRLETLPLPIREPPSPTSTLSPPRKIDWRANAARSAELTVEGAQQERHRSFGPRRKPDPVEPPPPSIFRHVPKPEYGDVGEVNDRPVVWMNGNCYMELDRSVQTARDTVIANSGGFAPPAINCVGSEKGGLRLTLPNPASFTPPSLNYSRAIGKRAVDGTLFEHIKKPEEPPVPKAGTEMNELPEREAELPGSPR